MKNSFPTLILALSSIFTTLALGQYAPVERVKAEITLVEQPVINQWTKVHVKATTLEDWRLNEVNVVIKNFSITKPIDGVLPKWIYCSKQGSVYEADFLIKPLHVGANALDIWFGSAGCIYQICFNNEGDLIFTGSADDLYERIGVLDTEHHKMTKEQYNEMIKLCPPPSNPKPLVGDNKIIFYSYPGNYYKIEFSPIPKLNTTTTVKFSFLLTDDKRRESLPNLHISNQTFINYIKPSAISDWQKDSIDDGFYYVTFTMKTVKTGKVLLGLEGIKQIVLPDKTVGTSHTSYGTYWIYISPDGECEKINDVKFQ